jgi:hypothetical protein
LLSLSPLNPSV